VKWAWELSRHHHLVVLARAASLDPANRRFLVGLEDQLRSWLDGNPPERGVHWSSNLEIALRAVAWLQILSLVGEKLGAGLRDEMAAVLATSGRHLVLELPYSLSSMRNNHLLGEALGLVAVGRSFPASQLARWWERVGDFLFYRQLRRQVRTDGSMIEDSVSYHRFSMEMLAMRVLLGGRVGAVREPLLESARFLARLGALEGDVPQYGDGDEGRVFASSGDVAGLRGSLRLALALAGSGAAAGWAEDDDEVAWHAHPGSPATAPAAERIGRHIGGGLARLQRDGHQCWLKAGSGPSHGHADLCSTALTVGATWVVGDPGTGAYNRSRPQRDWFRCSAAHSVVRLEGADQLVPHRAFRWRYPASGRIGAPVELSDGHLMWGVHDAYLRLTPPRRIARMVALTSAGMTVLDWVEGSSARYQLSVPLGPGVTWDHGRLLLPDGTELACDLPAPPRAVTGSVAPYQAWWSPSYGVTIPATRLEVVGVVDGPLCWAVRHPGAEAGRPEGGTVRLGSDRVELDWSEPGPRLLVSTRGATRVERLWRWP
jgi:hypothetical protein